MKAFASDFDGTLFYHTDGGHFLENDLKMIRKFQAEGNLFGICTGRSLYGITKVVKDEIDFDFYISNSGARVLDRNLKVLAELDFGREVMEEIHELYHKKMEMVVMADDTVYTTGKPYPLQTAVKSVEEIPGKIFGVSMAAENASEAKRIVAEINERFGKDVIAYQNISFIDIVAAGCSKGNAAKFVKEHFAAERLAGIGDSFNDIPLLNAADVAYTFHRCPNLVKEQAKVLVDSVEEAIRDFQEL